MKVTKKHVLSYLDVAGFANDGFGEPIPRNAMNAIKAFLAGDMDQFRSLQDKVRNQALHEVLGELPFAFPQAT